MITTSDLYTPLQSAFVFIRFPRHSVRLLFTRTLAASLLAVSPFLTAVTRWYRVSLLPYLLLQLASVTKALLLTNAILLFEYHDQINNLCYL